MIVTLESLYIFMKRESGKGEKRWMTESGSKVLRFDLFSEAQPKESGIQRAEALTTTTTRRWTAERGAGQGTMVGKT